MLATVELHDVGDAEAFVAAMVASTLAKHGIRLGFHDREDLEARGLEVMLELAQRYRPAHQRKGWPSFSSYAGDMLPRRLVDELRKRGTRGTDPLSGKRVWRPRVVDSLDRLMEAPSFDHGTVRVDFARFERERVAA